MQHGMSLNLETFAQGCIGYSFFWPECISDILSKAIQHDSYGCPCTFFIDVEYGCWVRYLSILSMVEMNDG